MKVLKSGIEVDPKDLNKLRGGACSCGCDIGDDSYAFNQMADTGGGCLCHCDSENPIGFVDMGRPAELQLKPRV